MPGERRHGMDHSYYPWSPLTTRGAFQWPGGARVALGVVVVLEHIEWEPPAGSYQSPGQSVMPVFPNYARFSLREYGHRVGIFRLLDLLERHGVRATVAMDAATAEHYPYLVRHCLDRGCEIVGHGVAGTQLITSRMAEEEEREYIRASIEALRKATGRAPAGWFGPDYGESGRTPRLLAEAGIRYVCDWVNDEQPYAMTTPSGDMVALPVTVDLDDLVALETRGMPVELYARMFRDAFDRLYEDGKENGRLLVPVVRPWLMGQPFRATYLEEALEHVKDRPGVWKATGSEMVDWFRQHPPAA